MSCISGTKRYQIAAFPLLIKKQRRYVGQYAGNSHAYGVVEVYIRYYY